MNIDELRVKITGDIKDFKTKVDKASTIAKTGVGKMNKAFSGLGNGIKNLLGPLNSFGGAVGVVAGATGLAALGSSALNTADDLAKLSGQIGINAEFLQEMRFAASQTGVAQAELDNSLRIFTKNIGEAASGNKTYADSFKALGVEVLDAGGNIKDSETLIKEVADGMQSLDSDTQRASIAFELMGRSGVKLVNTLKNGSAGLTAFQQEARALGIVVDADLLKNAEVANDQFDKLSRIISAQVSTAFLELAPTLTAIAQELIEASKGAIQFGKDIGLISERDPSKQIQALKVEIIDLEQEMIKLQKDDGIVLFRETRVASKREEIAKLTSELKALEEQNAKVTTGNKDSVPMVSGTGSAPSVGPTEEELIAQEQKEIEALERKNQLLRDVDAEAYEEQLATNQERIDTKVAALDQESEFVLQRKADQHKKEIEMEKKKAKQEEELAKKKSEAMVQIARNMNELLFADSKEGAIASTIINTYVAIQKALASAPPPFNVALAATQAALGAKNLSKIQGQNFRRGVDSIPGIGNQDNFPAVLAPGERVVPKETNKDLTRALKEGGMGGRGDVNLYVNVTPQNVLTGGADLVDMINDAVRTDGVKIFREAISS